ncbi:3-deoxy-D-manno-octulosonic acid kinase [uncultured Castellaniella sp.]|uniref:3-deoxy-D-manno-octulosonic acid kinase n=1 Tax=uncultured Castellaniella sp. TaxID=647907 RepID=UPI00261DFE0C|nr:3-deoxy-D-manno-octulosonic acid kinase [uncultured Castellaniella sp.]
MRALPSGWVRLPAPGGAVCAPERLAAVASDAWFDPRRPGAVAVGEGGRQAAWFVDGDHGAAVLRHYRRGGLRARLGRHAYCWLGESRVRAWAEVRALAHLRSAGLRVPEPLAAAYWRDGLSYRNAILVARIPGARSLAGQLDRADPEAVARAIRAMHEAGVRHADLNAYNILFDDRDRVWLIDFDRARLGVVSPGQRRKNLLRLRRSLVKVAGARGAQWWDALNGAYRRSSA